jgi:hypothetical protein
LKFAKHRHAIIPPSTTDNWQPEDENHDDEDDDARDAYNSRAPLTKRSSPTERHTHSKKRVLAREGPTDGRTTDGRNLVGGATISRAQWYINSYIY